ncbi:MAG: HNH endonuclease [Chaetfec virus UA24_144]|nr:MAG: HNH endonuclease [Chaetfec virus UA24_144]
MIRTYTELSRLKTFEERYEYLKLLGTVGESTFGFSRYLNQVFYHSQPWLKAKRLVLTRDDGCDLGISDRVIGFRPVIHHMNPITEEQLLDRDPSVFDPEFLITVSEQTHRAIHYGDADLLIPSRPIERRPSDTKLW